MQRRDPNLEDARIREAKIYANILAMTPGKSRLVHLFEAVARLLRRLLPPHSCLADPTVLPSSILVLEYWNLGDLAILMPFLRNLRHHFPKARICLLGNVTCASILDGQGILDEFVPVRVPWAKHFNRWRKYNPFSPDWLSLARTLLALRRRQFDWAFSGRMDVRDNLLLWLTGARRRIGYGIGGGTFLTDRIAPDSSRPHRADVWLRLLEATGVPVDRKAIRLRLTDTESARAQLHLASLGIPRSAFVIGVHPGARIATRRWGDDRFGEVARRVSEETEAHILWFSAPGDPSEAPRSGRCHMVSLDLRSFVAVLSLCRLLVCNDSGPMHLANLLGVPVVAIFGPQRPEWFGPRGTHDRVVIHPEFSCRPCFDYCIFDQPYCLRTISTNEVYNAVQDAFQQLTGAPEKTRRSRGMEALASHEPRPSGGHPV